MDLKSIICDYPIELIRGDLNNKVRNISQDSREIKEGDIFVAIKGFTVDGHDFIDKAITNGATTIILEEEREIKEDITIIKVVNSLDALAYFSSNFYENPFTKMEMIGITGTNGKTSTTYFIESIFRKNNMKSGIIGTLGSVIDGKLNTLANTTPDSLTIQSNLKKMVDKNTDICIMEVSSHALELKRVEYLKFDTGIFTNLSKDHLDYHNTIENYFNSKKKLFYKTTRFNILNIDDSYGKKILDEAPCNTPIITYGIKEKAQVYATDIKYHMDKVEFKLNTPRGNVDIMLNVPGEFSVYNALAAISCAYVYDIDLETIKEGIEAVEGIKGRFEVVPTTEEFTVIIDFAHTPEGLEKVLNVIDGFAEGRKIVLFGAGGNRDRTKRPEMGEIVAKHADLSIITSDNPRDEDPEMIIEDIAVGVQKISNNYVKIVDRIDAIHYALDIAKPKDIILLAGKGHETFTIIKGKTYPCDERQIVLDYINSK